MKTSGHTHWTAALELHLACACAYVDWAPNGFTPRAPSTRAKAASKSAWAERARMPAWPSATLRRKSRTRPHGRASRRKERPPAAENVAATAPNRNVSRVASADGGPVVMETPDRSAVPVEKPDPVQHSRAANPSDPLPGPSPPQRSDRTRNPTAHPTVQPVRRNRTTHRWIARGAALPRSVRTANGTPDAGADGPATRKTTSADSWRGSTVTRIIRPR